MSGFGEFLKNATLAGLLRIGIGNLAYGPNGPVRLPASNQLGRVVCMDNSLTKYGQPVVMPTDKTGRTYFSTTQSLTSLGGSLWIVDSYIGGDAAAGNVFNLRTDATGKLQVQAPSDSWGDLVDVSAGGWYQLQSANGKSVFLSIRGATAAPVSQTGTITATGLPQVWDYDPKGYLAFIAGACKDVFSGYEAWGIPGANTADTIKWMPQAFATDAEACVFFININDIPSAGATSANIATAISRHKQIIDYVLTKVRTLFLCESFPVVGYDAAGQAALAKVANALRSYVLQKPNALFVPIGSGMATFSASVATAKTGIYTADNIHTVPYGARQGAQPVIKAIQQQYPLTTIPVRCNALDTWDSTNLVGSWNVNPSLRGTGGFYGGDLTAAGNGVSGVGVPDGWTLTRSGTTQACVLSRDAAPDGGQDFLGIAVSGAASGDYHTLNVTSNVPSGVSAGDWFQVTLEIMIGACTGNGLAVLTENYASNNNKNGGYVIQLTPNFNVATFTTEGDVLYLKSKPQKLVAGETSITLRLRVGAAVGATGKISVRQHRIDKVQALS